MKRKCENGSYESQAKLPRTVYTSQAPDVVNGIVETELRGVMDNFVKVYESLNKTEGIDAKPNYSYTEMIYMALLRSPNFCLPITEIYRYITTKFPFFRTSGKEHWRNAVRHSLSKTKCFSKIAVGRGVSTAGTLQRSSYLWCFVPNSIISFARGDYRANVDKESGTNTLKWGYYRVNAGQFWERIRRIVETKMDNFKRCLRLSPSAQILESQVCNLQVNTTTPCDVSSDALAYAIDTLSCALHTVPYPASAAYSTATRANYSSTYVNTSQIPYKISPTTEHITNYTPTTLSSQPSPVTTSISPCTPKYYSTTTAAIASTQTSSPTNCAYVNDPNSPSSCDSLDSLHSMSPCSNNTNTDSGNETFYSDSSPNTDANREHDWSDLKDRLSPNASYISNYCVVPSPTQNFPAKKDVSFQENSASCSVSSSLDVDSVNMSSGLLHGDTKNGVLPCLDWLFRDFSTERAGYDFSYWFPSGMTSLDNNFIQSYALPNSYQFGNGYHSAITFA